MMQMANEYKVAKNAGGVLNNFWRLGFQASAWWVKKEMKKENAEKEDAFSKNGILRERLFSHIAV